MQSQIFDRGPYNRTKKSSSTAVTRLCVGTQLLSAATPSPAFHTRNPAIARAVAVVFRGPTWTPFSCVITRRLLTYRTCAVSREPKTAQQRMPSCRTSVALCPPSQARVVRFDGFLAREVGHSSTDVIEKTYGPLGQIRRCSEAVEYRVEQHRAKLEARLQKKLPLLRQTFSSCRLVSYWGG